ncbi:cytochrome C oxidase subunit IV family protein [Amycolatopsis echigonensis]|uniref:Cytochrome C oxidase subunit IV family protein n=1 Tax=Amycolatopsis echigonensis TaxID=2576905 RepID=A0A8E2B9L3_9PSEU|nr:cytochrome C oxidase subunit IV family protein [Amycolatopsis echigonensis]MBB2506251.1 cytochrome C oxidase subunit IV family protein [Amycolatopsis echigonensis]
MREFVPLRVFLVWVVLVVATAASWWLGADHPLAGVAGHAGSALVVVIAFVKVRYVGLDFMDLRSAPAPLRLAFTLWIVSAGVATVALVLV